MVFLEKAPQSLSVDVLVILSCSLTVPVPVLTLYIQLNLCLLYAVQTRFACRYSCLPPAVVILTPNRLTGNCGIRRLKLDCKCNMHIAYRNEVNEWSSGVYSWVIHVVVSAYRWRYGLLQIRWIKQSLPWRMGARCWHSSRTTTRFLIPCQRLVRLTTGQHLYYLKISHPMENQLLTLPSPPPPLPPLHPLPPPPPPPPPLLLILLIIMIITCLWSGFG